MKLRSALLVIGTTTLVAGGIAVPASSAAAPRLTCTAKVSNAHPKQRSTVYVQVHSAAATQVRTWAHYKTTVTPHQAVANSAGNASVPYRISTATHGYRVRIDVRVDKRGYQTGACTTYFTTA